MTKTLVLYVFHICNDRVKQFIDNAIFKDESVDFIVISNDKENKFEVPEYAKILTRDNIGYDFGGWSHALIENHGNMHGYGTFYDQEGRMIYDGPVANNGPVQEEEEEEEPTFANNPANIFQQQNPPQSGNIFGSRPDFFEPGPPRPPQRE